MANKIYGLQETAITFTDTGGTALTLANLGFGAGRVSTQQDKGSGSQATLFKVRGIFQFETAPAEGETVDIYIAEGDGTNIDGGLGSSDAAVTDSDILKNLLFAGSITAHAATAATTFEASFTVSIRERYYSVLVWNSSAADNLKNTSGTNKVIVTPVPQEVQ